MVNHGFCDLCIDVATSEKKKLRTMLNKLHELGYETVALNDNVDENIFDNDKLKKKKKGGDAVPVVLADPVNIDEIVQEFKGKLHIFRRLTYSFLEPSKTYRLNQSTVLKNYNIYAVVPKTQNALQFACTQLNADIIYINSSCNNLRLNRKLYLQAINRGIHFEIQYSDLINLTTRKFAIHWSHLFYTYGKCKNVIISSGAKNMFYLRSPYDIILLASIFGIQGQNAQSTILSQCHKLLYKAERRIMGKSVFTLKVDEDTEEDTVVESMEL